MWDFIGSFVREFLLPAAISLGSSALGASLQPRPEAPPAPQFNFDLIPKEQPSQVSNVPSGAPQGPSAPTTNPTAGVQGFGSPTRNQAFQSFTGGFTGVPSSPPAPITGYSSGFTTLDQSSQYNSSMGAKKRPGFYGV